MSDLKDASENNRPAKGKPRGVPFAPGNKIGFGGHPENICKTSPGRPRTKIISQAYKDALETDVPDVSSAALAHLEPLARALKEVLGRAPTYAELLALGMTVAAIGGNSAAAKEIREVTEGKIPDKIDFSGKIDYSAGQTGKDLLSGKLLARPEQKFEEPDGND